MLHRSKLNSTDSALYTAVLVFIAAIAINHSYTSHARDTTIKHMRKPLPMPEEIAALPADGGQEFNRLIFEESPYLLQHARNPVDWHPWGDEAFKKAGQQDKPVFLSIGYSTCHWCHVMEHESFEDIDVAELMNKHFISVKVDREERPDIDDVYMTVTQALTGSGGWPMTVVMTSDKKPFFAGTYFPKSGKFGRPGMMELIPALANVWKNERHKVLTQAQQIINALGKYGKNPPGENLTKAELNSAFDMFSTRFDKDHGGFGTAPKFPVPHSLSFLLRYWKRTGEAHALTMASETLKAMRSGGIYDHIGYGFHRYSTDTEWLLPHFEKMLYDQALLAIAYIEAFQATSDEEFADVAREIFTYVLRDMTSENGGFYSAEDADSEGEEGKFYIWKPKEIREILGKDDGDLFIHVYNVKKGGNFRDQSTGEKTGDSIPHLQKPLQVLAKDLKMPLETLEARLEKMRTKLFDEREKRIHPLKDDKILTDWNGLMIAALAKAGEVLEESKYVAAAKKAADFVLNHLRSKDGRLLKRYRRGKAGLPAHLDDYAFFVWGLIDLYEATFDDHYLNQAIELTDTMIKHFWDNKNGGFFMTADDGEKLLIRSKTVYDGAIPSGNSVAALNTIRLARMTGNADYETRCHQTLRAFSGSVGSHPAGHAQLLIVLDFAVGPAYEVVICGEKGSRNVNEMLSAIHRNFIPNKVLLFKNDSLTPPPITQIAPFTKAMKSIDDKGATVYVCENFTCKLPTTDIKTMLASLNVTKKK